MKFFSSFLILFSGSLLASPLILFEYQHNTSGFRYLRHELIEHYKVPAETILFRQKDAPSKTQNELYHFYLNKNDELKLIYRSKNAWKKIEVFND